MLPTAQVPPRRASAEQARPLIPGSSGCLTLIASRRRLPGLVARNGARRIALDVLSPEASVAAAAILGGLTVETARAELARLADVHLIQQPEADRFSINELFRLYGAERAAGRA